MRIIGEEPAAARVATGRKPAKILTVKLALLFLDDRQGLFRGTYLSTLFARCHPCANDLPINLHIHFPKRGGFRSWSITGKPFDLILPLLAELVEVSKGAGINR